MSTALRLTVEQYDRMVDQGAFDNLCKKIELIRGEIQSMNPAGPRHDGVIEYLTDWSTASIDRESMSVRIQSGLSLPEVESRPEPDLLWVIAKRSRGPSDRQRRAACDRSFCQQPGSRPRPKSDALRGSKHQRVLDHQRRG